MKNDDRIQILTESGGNWTGTWEELIDVTPDWLGDVHRVHVQDLIAILDQGNAYNGGGTHKGERFFVFRKGLEISDIPSIKKYKEKGIRHEYFRGQH